MLLNQSNAIGLAKVSCSLCHGIGVRFAQTREVPCNCIFRAIFRACLNRFRQCTVSAGSYCLVCWSSAGASEGRGELTRGKQQEYAADFCLVSRRTLDES